MTAKQSLYMLWQELDPKKTPEQIVQEAAAHYQRKYGQALGVVRAPLTFPDLNGKTPAGLSIERHKDIAPTYLWLQIPDIQPSPDPTDSHQQVQDA